MIETLLVFGSVLLSLTGAEDLENCTVFHLDIVQVSDVQVGTFTFEYGGAIQEMQVMKTNPERQFNLTIPIGYNTFIEGCVPQ